MAFDLRNFQDAQLDADYVDFVIDNQSPDNEAFHNRLWNYFRNPLMATSAVSLGAANENSRPYTLAQEIGLPARITGVQRNGGKEQMTDLRRKEVVIENDIGWRVQTMVDFLFGKGITVRSQASDPELAGTIEQVISTMLEANGGLAFLQEMALFGAIFGHVDIALRIPADWPATVKRPPLSAVAGLGGSKELPRLGTPTHSRTRAVSLAGKLRLETIEAGRVLPILAEDDYRQTRYWMQRFFKHPARLANRKRPWLKLGRSAQALAPELVEVVEILSPNWWQRYEGRKLAAEGPNLLGRIPVVHIQNVASPGTYAGGSDVEPLIPLQDELNTRLSDRAHRVTYQSFKMYLGKGIDDFLERPVGPGQMWATQNPHASIEEFGNDAGSPSENVHIEQIRQALDKTSGVSPLTAGLLQGRVGNLSSATALKVVLSGLLARTARKRLTYGAGLQQLTQLALDWLDRTGVLPTRPDQRRVDVHWPSPLPSDEAEQLKNAQIKQAIGVPADRILAELGYERQE